MKRIDDRLCGFFTEIDKLPNSEPSCAAIDALEVGGATTEQEKAQKGQQLYALCKYYMRQCPKGDLFSQACTDHVLDSCKARSKQCGEL